MQKGNINFKEIRKKVIHYQNNQNSENIPMNPTTTKVSFRGIKRNQQITPIQIMMDSTKKGAYMSPIKIMSTRNRIEESNRQDCNKFSILLESKGYANSNCNSGRKKSTEVSFRMLVNNSSKTKLNTERSQTEYRLKTQGTQRIKTQYRLNTERNEGQSNKADSIQQKCRQIKQKQYFSSRPVPGELNSLNKLKNKLISPLKKKNQAPPQPVLPRQQKIINIFEHSSILSQHDLVNMSKTNQSIDFDMSPWL